MLDGSVADSVRTSFGLRYFNSSSLLSDPSTGAPALTEWYTSGAKAVETHYQNGEIHDPAIEVPARRAWWRNGVRWYESNYDTGVCTAAAQWDDKGEPMA